MLRARRAYVHAFNSAELCAFTEPTTSSSLSFTLDTNCLFALEEKGPEASAIRALVDLHREGTSSVAVVAISASENPKRGEPPIANFADFQHRLNGLGLGEVAIIRPMLYFDISFWDWAVWSDSEAEFLEQRIHSILFPNEAFKCEEYCAQIGAEPKQPLDRNWRNHKCDVQAIWAHIFNKRRVFVTADANFHKEQKKASLLAVGAGAIAKPYEAFAMLTK